MTLPEQRLTLQSLDNSYHRELKELVAAETVRRLWAKDVSLWPAGEAGTTDISSNLNWLDLPERVQTQIADVADFVTAAQAEGFEDVVFVARGDSNLAARAV